MSPSASCAIATTKTMDEPAATHDSSEQPSPGAEEQLSGERALLRRYGKDRSPVVREELVDRFMPLARRLASRYAGGAEPYDDLVQVASGGLVKAIDRFDLERGVEFSTYATPTIVGELKRYFRDKGWAIRVPRRLQELSLRLNKVVATLTQQLGRSPTVGEIARVAAESTAMVAPRCCMTC